MTLFIATINQIIDTIKLSPATIIDKMTDSVFFYIRKKKFQKRGSEILIYRIVSFHKTINFFHIYSSMFCYRVWYKSNSMEWEIKDSRIIQKALIILLLVISTFPLPAVYCLFPLSMKIYANCSTAISIKKNYQISVSLT